MVDSQLPSSGMRPKIKVVDGVAEGQVGLELHVDNSGKRGGAPEEITDDDVFKELINIVMDVFANKSEKCMLTFELPSESSILNEETSELAPESSSDVSSSASKSDLVLPLKDSKKAKRKRRLKLPIAKPSKCNEKNKLNKRIHPIVQTVLQGEPGFTNLQRLFRMQSKTSWKGRERWYHCGKRKNGGIKIANSWKDTKCEREALVQEASKFIEPSPSQDGNLECYPLGALYNEFKEVTEAFEELLHSQEDHRPRLSTGELTYHLEEIQCHIDAIRSLLKDSAVPSLQSSDITLQQTESSEAPKRRTKVGVKLIRIGTKMRQTSSVQIATSSRKTNKSIREGKLPNAGLKEILTTYQKVKREETEIVKVLLGKLGFDENCSGKKWRRRRTSPKTKRLEEKKKSSSKPSHALERYLKPGKNFQGGERENGENTLDEPRSRQQPTRRVTEQKYEKHRRNDEKNSKRRLKVTAVRSRKDQVTKEKDQTRIKKKNRCSKGFKRPTVQSSSETPQGSPGNSRKTTQDGNAAEDSANRSLLSAANSEEKMMISRMQSAAKQLEYMHQLVEEKLKLLCEKERQLKRTGKKKKWKTKAEYKPKMIHRCPTSVNDVYRLAENCHLNLSTGTEESAIIMTYKDQPEEPDGSNDALNGSSAQQGCQEGSRAQLKDELCKNSPHEPKPHGTRSSDKILCRYEQNYVCNYMMNLPDPELELAATGSNKKNTEHKNEHIREVEALEDASLTKVILDNEFEATVNKMDSNKDPTANIFTSISSKANESEIIEESLFANPRSVNTKAQKSAAQKKKKAVLLNPSCTLS